MGNVWVELLVFVMVGAFCSALAGLTNFLFVSTKQPLKARLSGTMDSLATAAIVGVVGVLLVYVGSLLASAARPRSSTFYFLVIGLSWGLGAFAAYFRYYNAPNRSAGFWAGMLPSASFWVASLILVGAAHFAAYNELGLTYVDAQKVFGGLQPFLIVGTLLSALSVLFHADTSGNAVFSFGQGDSVNERRARAVIGLVTLWAIGRIYFSYFA